MWKDILKTDISKRIISGDFSGFFRDFEKNKIVEIANGASGFSSGWAEIQSIASEYNILNDAATIIFRSHNPSWKETYTIPAVDIKSYNRAVREQTEREQKRKFQQMKDSRKPRRKGQRRRR